MEEHDEVQTRASQWLSKIEYHKRSNAESTNSAFKRKFGDILASRKWNMQKIETGIRVVIYNIRLLIRYRIRTEMELLD